MYKSLHQINNECKTEMDATCNRTSEMSKSESLIFTEENARKVCQWLSVCFIQSTGSGRLEPCGAGMSNKKLNIERENPRH